MSELTCTVQYFTELDGVMDIMTTELILVGQNESVQFELLKDGPGTLVTTFWNRDGDQVSQIFKAIGPRSCIMTYAKYDDSHAVNQGEFAKWHATGGTLRFGGGGPIPANTEGGTGTVSETADGSQSV
jgi:hypothetical protein